jgi:hypothetical protein
VKWKGNYFHVINNLAIRFDYCGLSHYIYGKETPGEKYSDDPGKNLLL